MAVTEAAARQAAISMLGGDSNILIDAYEELLGHRTKYEQIHLQHSGSLLPVGQEAKVITRLMGEEKYRLAYMVLSRIIQLMQSGSDGSSTELSIHN